MATQDVFEQHSRMMREAIDNRNFPRMKALLNTQYVTVNDFIKHEKEVPFLHFCLRSMKLDIAQFFLDAGADPLVRAQHIPGIYLDALADACFDSMGAGSNPAQYKKERVELLRSHGVKVAPNENENDDCPALAGLYFTRITPPHRWSDSATLAERIIEMGASVNAQFNSQGLPNYQFGTPLYFLYKHKPEDYEGNGYEELKQFLLDRGAYAFGP